MADKNESFFEEKFQSGEDVDAYSENLLDAINNGATLKDIQGVPNKTMQDVYNLAYSFYHTGKLDDAESLFRFLCVYDFYNYEYVIGLAAVHQLKKNYAKAIDFYALAYSLSDDDYRPMFYAGQCNLMLRQSVQARKCFDIVLERCSDKLLCQKAKAYLSALDKLKREKEASCVKTDINED
ncbi:type III secretion low calcium response chaperone LcrH/SycD [Izhakiella capsodis]|uniref:Type III secretion low calcium response chaperone LcrH/SycD n=1 Tax=Izhakiella capsodis TaxID=1367852 RepID=A0A1I5AWV4_9GAMM|nr:type III secretion system translocator chaperone SicA [Izhakiella capsodis]SFN66709.1 type III secretion low calcium response chaperone LcrH/SycD [Izhakiella capsodis]